jgi:23S rRNA (adenine2503-C2)-methyltransferase
VEGGASSFSEMTNLSRELRDSLEKDWTLRSSTLKNQALKKQDSQRLTDADGTVKIQVELEDAQTVEAALLVDGKGRRTACLSTQAGCPCRCVFCKTGSLGWARNLSAAEIVEQFFYLRDLGSGNADANPISNIVVMGMGEPLLNLDALRIALPWTALAPRRITISTSGIVEGILSLAGWDEDYRLAVSLTTAREDLRRRLMPVAAGNPLPELKKALLEYQKKKGKRITLEAALLGGINTTREDAAAIAGFASGLEAIVNLIPWNPVAGLGFEGKPLLPPSAAEKQSFYKMLRGFGLKAEFRREKGGGANAACGQLGIVT